MPGYVSEFVYYGEEHLEFIEVALPAGTDPSGYTVQTYDAFGDPVYTFSLGTATGSMGGYDVYVLDTATAGWNNGDPSGNLYADDAIALVDGSGTVEQFISWEGNTVTPVSGDAAGMTSTSVGTATYGTSLQSDNGGSSYYHQTSTNSGTIPACYAKGTQIKTPSGYRSVETLSIGDSVLTAAGQARAILWLWTGRQPLESAPDDAKPVLIKQGALGPARPTADLVVSAQHRIAVGIQGQLADAFANPCLVPAKALTSLPGIRMMHGKKQIDWYHIVCADHELLVSQNAVSESMLLGTQVLTALRPIERAGLGRSLGRVVSRDVSQPPALPCLTVRAARRALYCAPV